MHAPRLCPSPALWQAWAGCCLQLQQDPLPRGHRRRHSAVLDTPSSPEISALCESWLALFKSSVGRPETHEGTCSQTPKVILRKDLQSLSCMERALGVGGRRLWLPRDAAQDLGGFQPRCVPCAPSGRKGYREVETTSQHLCAHQVLKDRVVFVASNNIKPVNGGVSTSAARRPFCCAGQRVVARGSVDWSLVEGLGGGCARNGTAKTSVLRGALGHVPPLVRSAQATARPVLQMRHEACIAFKAHHPHVSRKADIPTEEHDEDADIADRPAHRTTGKGAS